MDLKNMKVGETKSVTASELKHLTDISPNLVKPAQAVLDTIIELRKAVGVEFKSYQHGPTIPAYLKGYDKKLADMYKEIEDMFDTKYN